MRESRYLRRRSSRVLRRVFAAFVVAVAMSCGVGRQSETRPFRYEQVIDGISPGGLTDRRLELRRCVELWEPWATTRAELFESLARRGVFKKRQTVLLEVGHPVWSHYGYALAVDGVIQPGPLDAHEVGRGDGKRMSTSEGLKLRSHVDARVDDGTCWFLTTVDDGRRAQIAVYGELEETGDASALVRQMMGSLEQPDIPDRAR